MALKASEAFRDIQLASGTVRENDALSPEKLILWKEEAAGTQQRITSQARPEIVEDAEARWVAVTTQIHEEIRRNIFQRLTGGGLEGAIIHPNKTPYKATGKKSDNFIFWSRSGEQALNAELTKRWQDQSGITKLGPNTALLQGKTPLRSVDEVDDYYPKENPLMSADDAWKTYANSMDFILGQVFEFPRDGEDPLAEHLRELKHFRASSLRGATLKDNAIIGIEHCFAGTSWMVIVPPDHWKIAELKSPASVDVHHAMNIMHIKPVKMTREWAGLLTLHELQHLNDFVTGREPKNPNRKQYIEGEVRAYSSEMIAAEILTKGKFWRTLDAVCREYKFHTPDGLQSLTDAKTLNRLSRDLDGAITAEKPLSFDEANIRQGFYQMMAGFWLASLAAKTPADVLNMRAGFIEHVYAQREGLLPKE